jgi:hypothetical protein
LAPNHRAWLQEMDDEGMAVRSSNYISQIINLYYNPGTTIATINNNQNS